METDIPGSSPAHPPNDRRSQTPMIIRLADMDSGLRLAHRVAVKRPDSDSVDQASRRIEAGTCTYFYGRAGGGWLRPPEGFEAIQASMDPSTQPTKSNSHGTRRECARKPRKVQNVDSSASTGLGGCQGRSPKMDAAHAFKIERFLVRVPCLSVRSSTHTSSAKHDRARVSSQSLGLLRGRVVGRLLARLSR